MSGLSLYTSVVLGGADVVSLELSIPYWTDLSREPANRGFVRHGGVARAIDHVEPKLKPTYPQHVREYLTRRGDHGTAPRALLAWGTRNTFQNLGLPGWDVRRRPRLLCRPDEPWRAWEYHALGCRENGRPELFRTRFQGTSANDATPAPLDAAVNDASDMRWIVTGQPLIWDGKVTPLDEIAARTYDLRHIWPLRWEDWQRCPDERAIHDELMAIFLQNLNEPMQRRAHSLAAAAGRHALRETTGYLHSSLGITPSGELILLMKTGALSEIAAAQLALGSTRAILLDNGGSVGAAYWSQFAWQQHGWETSADRPVFFGNGTYFRPRGHAVLIAELASDLPDGPSAAA